MDATEQASRPAPRLNQGKEETVGAVSASAMAALRLRGAFDVAQRAHLSGRQLVRLAERITAGTLADDDRDLISAFDAVDLDVVNITPVAFIVGHADIWRVVACHAALAD